MPRLQILVHKSYHPYLESNKQKVREDEAKARAEELLKEQKMIDNEAEARLTLLRRRAGSPLPNSVEEDDNLPSTSSTLADIGISGSSSVIEKHRRNKAREEKREKKLRSRNDFDFPSETVGRGMGKERERGRERERYEGEPGEDGLRNDAWENGGHVNLFSDIEKNPTKTVPPPTLAEIAKKKADQEADPFTMYLGRPERETKPWYTDRELKRAEEREIGEEAEEKRAREKRKDIRSKERNDPLTSIQSLLYSSTSKSKPKSKPYPNPITDPSAARINREQSERQRALALIAQSKQPLSRAWDDTPSTDGRSWAESLEREKERAGRRFFGDGAGGKRWDDRDISRGGGRMGGRSWEV